MSSGLADAAHTAAELTRWLSEAAFPLWWETGADHVRGGFHEKIGLDGVPVEAPRRARVQPRQVYAFSRAGALGWNGPWEEAVDHGLRYFLGHYQRPDGLFRTLIAPDGTVLDDQIVLYDQAFALLALAAIKQGGRADADVEAIAVAVRQAIVRGCKHPLGGFLDPSQPQWPLLANPHMHLLEACLAWVEADGDAAWLALAEEIVGLALERMIDPTTGAVREFFTAQWQPAPGLDGRIVEPGHQYEWAWLLLRFSKYSTVKDIRSAALRMIALAERHGIVPGLGVACNALLDDMTRHDPQARLWPQTERIKAAVAAAAATGDAKYWRMAADAAAALQRYLGVPVAGLWRDRLEPDGRFVDEPAPASSFYHIVCAIEELDAALSLAAPSAAMHGG